MPALNEQYCMEQFQKSLDIDSTTGLSREVQNYLTEEIGPGTSNSHGYERTHMDALKNTYGMLTAHLLQEDLQ